MQLKEWGGHQVNTMQTLSEEGVIKVNSRILEAHELKKLDKSEKSLVNAIHVTGKGRFTSADLLYT